MKTVTSKSGKLLKGRQYEFYTGDCPPERPCTPEQIETHRKLFDQLEPAPLREPGSTKNKLWKWMGQAMSYVEAKARWMAAGSPVTPPEELALREGACQICPHHNAKLDGCGLCGCGIDGGSLDEKRRMATESCPADEPRWLA